MKRILNLDVIRVIALLLIISNHALNTVYDATNYSLWLNVSIIEKTFILLGYITCRLGVPLFLMISGALILNKNFETGEDIKKFYKNNLLKLIIAIMLWNIIYYCFDIFYNNLEFSLKELLYIILFMQKSPMPHMWYMPMIVGMYIVLPFISVVVKKFDFKSLFLPLLVALIVFYFVPNLSTFFDFINFTKFSIRTIIDVSALGGTYALYIIMGYYIYNKNILKSIKTSYLIVLIILFIIFACGFQTFGYIHESTYIIYYNFIGIFFASILLFELLIRVEFSKNERFNKIITTFSIVSLGIYFIHRPILLLFKKYWILNFHSCINVIIYYIVSIILSLIIVYIMKKIKIIKKYMLLIKN